MTELKRNPIKYVRDFIKREYKLRDHCYVCKSVEKLELHHLYSVSELFNRWLDTRGIRIVNTEEQILEYRVEFAKDCADKLSHEHLYTLCDVHHKRLHSIYGQTYSNSMAPKIKNWLEIQREKHGN
jgi:5-methylcytosine-specific restriction endonuclease McrA